MAGHDGDNHSTSEGGENRYGRKVTSTISARKGNGRNVYIYLEKCDSMEYRDLLPAEGRTTWVRVEMDMEGHRHWQVKLAPEDTLGTGEPEYPPPPPPGGGG